MVDEATRQRAEDGQACLDAALSYLTLGWSVLALCPHDHVGIRLVSKNHSKTCDSPGKRPWHTWKDYQTERAAEDVVREWWRVLPNSNVGIALGPASGLIRVDVEGESGEAKLLQMSGGDLPRTLEFRSGRAGGGRGLLYSIPPHARIATTYEKPKPGEEVRLQAKGAMTVLPPSRHPSGNLYEWLPGQGPHEIKHALAPAWLLKRLEAKAEGRGEKSTKDWDSIFAGTLDGSRHDSMLSYIGKLLYSLGDIEDNLAIRALWAGVEAINERNDPPLADDDLQGMFINLLRSEKRRRKDEYLAQLDKKASAEIDKTEAASNNGQAGEHNGPPPWQLIRVNSDPMEYLLRSPEWSYSQNLKDGFLPLSQEQIVNWTGRGNCISIQAYKMTGIVVEPVMKNWMKPGGHLDRLSKCATTVEVVPESKRGLFILGFVYRYLAGARPALNGDGKVHLSVHGTPVRMEDDSIVFKLADLKRKIGESRENFEHREVLRLLESNGFTQEIIANSRWWKLSRDKLDEISTITLESGHIAPMRVENNGAQDNAHHLSSVEDGT